MKRKILQTIVGVLVEAGRIDLAKMAVGAAGKKWKKWNKQKDRWDYRESNRTPGSGWTPIKKRGSRVRPAMKKKAAPSKKSSFNPKTVNEFNKKHDIGSAKDALKYMNRIAKTKNISDLKKIWVKDEWKQEGYSWNKMMDMKKKLLKSAGAPSGKSPTKAPIKKEANPKATSPKKITKKEASIKAVEYALDDTGFGRYKNKIKETQIKDGNKYYLVKIGGFDNGYKVNENTIARKLKDSGWKDKGNWFFEKNGMKVRVSGRPGIYVFPSFSNPEAVIKHSSKKEKEGAKEAKKMEKLSKQDPKTWPHEVKIKKGNELIKKLRKKEKGFDNFRSQHAHYNEFMGKWYGTFIPEQGETREQAKEKGLNSPDYQTRELWARYAKYENDIKKMEKPIKDMGWYRNDGSWWIDKPNK